MRFLLSTGVAWRVHTLKETERLALESGYSGVELMLRDKVSGEEKRDRNYQSLQKIDIVHASGELFNQERYEKSLEETIEVAKEVGVKRINVHPASMHFGGRRNVELGIEKIKQYEKDTSLEILYEVLMNWRGLDKTRQKWFEQNQGYENIEDWVTDVKEYDLSATLDVCHIGTWGANPIQVMRSLGDNLKHIHLSDYSKKIKTEHLVPGDGDMDIDAFLVELNKTHPNITVTLELIDADTTKEVHDNIKRSREFIRQVLDR